MYDPTYSKIISAVNRSSLLLGMGIASTPWHLKREKNRHVLSWVRIKTSIEMKSNGLQTTKQHNLDLMSRSIETHIHDLQHRNRKTQRGTAYPQTHPSPVWWNSVGRTHYSIMVLPSLTSRLMASGLLELLVKSSGMVHVLWISVNVKTKPY